MPLNRQSESYAPEGIHLDVSALGGWVGACTAALAPLLALIHKYVLAADRLHGDDMTVTVLAKSKTSIGQLWTCFEMTGHSAALSRRQRCFLFTGQRW